jgi:predicted transposase YdaD
LKGKTEIVQRMKAKGFSVEDISEITGLAIEEVKKLLQ